MFKEIKSFVIFNKIFKFLIDERKFALAKYNKRIQKILNINIIDYMNLSGKYIIYERKGVGKEYNGYNNILLYEGEFKMEKEMVRGKNIIKKEN